MTHEVKILPKYFKEVFLGHKTFELRKNDRDYRIDDIVILNEWNDKTKTYTGMKIARRITYILKDVSFGLDDGYVIFSIG